MINLIAWFNGRKTSIGAGMLFLAEILTKVVVGVWAFNPSWMNPSIETLSYFGLALTGLGLGHKGMKAYTDAKTAKLEESKPTE